MSSVSTVLKQFSDRLNNAAFMLKFGASVVLFSRASVVHAQAPSRFLKQRADLTRVRGITMNKSVLAAVAVVAVLAACDKPAPVVVNPPSNPSPPVVVTPAPPPAPAPGAVDSMKAADKASDAAKDAKGSAMDAKDAAKDAKDTSKDMKK
jgi:hypothetical protein